MIAPKEIGRFDVPNGAVIKRLRFFPDGRRVVACYRNDMGRALAFITIFDIEQGKAHHTDNGTPLEVENIAISPDGGVLLCSGSSTGRKPGRVVAWNTRTWDPMWSVSAEHPIRTVAFDTTSRRIAACDVWLRITYHDVKKGKAESKPIQLGFQNLGQPVSAMSFSPDLRQLALACSTDLTLFDLTRHCELWSIHAHPHGLEAAVFAPDGKHVATAASEGTVRIWDAATGKRRNLLRKPTTEGIECLAWSGDARQVLAGGWDKSVHVWKVDEKGAAPQTIEAHEGCVLAADWSPANGHWVTGSHDGTVRVWQVSEAARQGAAATSGKPIKSLVAPRPLRPEVVRAVKSANRRARRHSQPAPFDLLRVRQFARIARIGVRLHPRQGTVKKAGASKLGGQLLWPAGEPWPTCPTHGRPMLPAAQLAKADVPEMRFPRGKDLLQVLWCADDHGDGAPLPRIFWRKATAVKGALAPMPEPTDAERSREYVVHPCALHPERVIEFPDAFEISDELRRVLEKIEDEHQEVSDYQSSLSATPGWKVGGWPDWIQDPYYPPCAHCGKPMEHLMTIASWEFDGASYVRWLAKEEASIYPNGAHEARNAVQSPAQVMLGDAGNQYLFVCYACDPSQVQSIMQCS